MVSKYPYEQGYGDDLCNYYLEIFLVNEITESKLGMYLRLLI